MNSSPTPPQIEQLKVVAHIPSGKTTEGQIILKIYSKQERVKRTLLTLFAFWGLSLLSILIPILHFVLVPLFFFLAPYLAMVKWQQDAGIMGGQCICPECLEKIPLGSLKAKWPLKMSCLNCKSTVRVDKQESYQAI